MPLFATYITDITITTTIIALFAILITKLFARSLQRRSSNHDWFIHTQLHTRLTEFLLTACRLLCLAFLKSNAISIMNVPEVECSCSGLLGNTIVTSFLLVYNVHLCCVRLRCAFIIYLFHTIIRSIPFA